MAKLLITAAEVITLAFSGHGGMSAGSVPETVILSCQEKFIRPVVNGLYDRLLAGGYGVLCDQYIKPALAAYVKYALVPHIAYSFGDMGVTVLKSSSIEACSEKELAAVRKAIKTEANGLIRRAVEYIEQNTAFFPEYDPKENVLNRVGISSQFVI